MAGKIFINYRRDDDPGYTQALYQRLEGEFASDDLFYDIEGHHIRPGDDLRIVLNEQVARADVVLAVIGPRWAELLAARQDDHDDYHTTELQAALKQRKMIIPVLVGRAAMPRSNNLPEWLRPLAGRSAMGLLPERFKGDCQGLIGSLKERLAAAEKERAGLTEAERKAAEATRLEAEAQAAARAKAAEARGRAQAMPGLSAAEAEELANWAFINEREDIQDLRDHLARFPRGRTKEQARARLAALVWAGLGRKPGLQALRAYLDEFPNEANSVAAQAQIAALEQEAAEAEAAKRLKAQETESWGAVAASTDIATIRAFLREWPNGQHAAAAKSRIAELRRAARSRWRGILLGAGSTAALTALIYGALLTYQLVRLWPQFWDVSVKAEAAHDLKLNSPFRDCANCPWMVVVEEGNFIMGSPSKKKDQGPPSDETPPHKVTFESLFAVGKYEVTFDEWDACVAHGGCKQGPNDWFWRRGRRPIMKVSWDEAKEYVTWIGNLTGRAYRLLTESEWEYAARAGSVNAYYWGSKIGRGNANCANCTDQLDTQKAKIGWFNPNEWGLFSHTAKVGSFNPNNWELFDTAGNVAEWVEDCYHGTYEGAPDDGSAWITGDCKERVFRGGAWNQSFNRTPLGRPWSLRWRLS